ncbi:hypothetical protein NBRC116583_26170 [Arenicella sp. 4NH20-0111]|uniref:type II secretion system minor pseudopilin GspK n=1 Tax=Arenicella sp. 4NH20-0111 TaxID=3127648 RepID=UPI00310B73D9
MGASHRVQNSSFKPIAKQRGLVMLMVVGVVVLMITLLALMLEDQHMLIRQIGNQRIVEQSRQYSHGLNAWAMRVLHEDANRQIDHSKEKWAKFGRPQPEDEEDEDSFSLDSTLARGQEDDEEDPKIDFGIDTLSVTIEDLQGRYNLNNLVEGGAKGKVNVQQKQVFLNLLQILEVGEFQEDREELYAAVVDWLDENDTSAGRGAESGDYQIRSTPYFAGDQPLSNIGELKYVKGFSKKIISKLRPFVTVLPVHNARLNLNSVKTQVLASLAGGAVADTAPASGFLARKEQPGFQGFQGGDIQAAYTAVNGVSPGSKGATQNMLQVNSQFFQINTKVELGDTKVCTRTIVLRQSANPEKLTDQTITVLSREQDTICKEEAEDSGAEESIIDEDLR